MSPPAAPQRGTPVIVILAAVAAGFTSALMFQWLSLSTSMESAAVGIAELSSTGSKGSPAAANKFLAAGPTVAARPSPGRNGYLIIGEFDFYRFTNNKIQLIEALAMAESMQRTLIVPRFLKCREQSLSLMFDMNKMSSRVDVIEDPDLTLDLSNVCGKSAQDNVYIKYESFTQGAMNKNTKPLPVPTMPWRGVEWTTHTQKTLPLSPVVPLPREIGAGPLHLRSPWFEWWPAVLIEQELPRFTADSMFVHKLVSSPLLGNQTRCVVVEETFLSVDWSQHPTSFWVNATSAVVGSPPIMRQVAMWQAANGLVAGQYAAAHVRMSDILGQKKASHDCASTDTSLFANYLTALRAKHGIPASMPLALASDEFGQQCVIKVEQSAPKTTRVELRGMSGPTNNCINSIFIQEALAQSAVFLGTAKSTFSTCVDWIRRMRYGYAADTTHLV